MEADWSALPHDVLAAIFARLPVDELLLSAPGGAGAVCRSWRDAAKDPATWRSVDMSVMPLNTTRGSTTRISARSIAMAAVDRSAGQLEAFRGVYLVTDELLHTTSPKAAFRSPSLKSLAVTGSNGVTSQGLEAVVDGCPRLECLVVFQCPDVLVEEALVAKCAQIRLLCLLPSIGQPKVYRRLAGGDDD
ncbi:LOW QUALITY PROTEIN: hypothetical protein BRADI_4g04775v3 [Brachypodium distachyon]|uniref:F-box domain-containing protein n=1 Tax=Brachypodium distachyon TaxID=15368 RepID=A0A2K2CKH9_BRADI|nr:LOW QUALITY PROTEIN: hypothetical protein BRADI_4g04775v3 [Brachypodium distachyon]